MAELRDSLLRSLLHELESGRALALVMAGSPWKCCPGGRDKGPAGCTCWCAEYDRAQADPDPAAVVGLALGDIQPPRRRRMCGDCVVVATALRRVRAVGDIRISAVSGGDYQPPIVDGVPYRADGRPGLLCAGWAARSRALKATQP